MPAILAVIRLSIQAEEDWSRLQSLAGYEPRKLALYFGKALHPSIAKKHGVKFTSPQGQVFGRRCSIAESINAAAITRHRERLALSTPTTVDDIPAVVPW